MKKIISVLLAVTIILGMSACNKSDDTSQAWRIVTSFSKVEKDKGGMFVGNIDNQLEFLDFETMQQTQICDDPTCKHLQNGDCTSNDKNNHPFIYMNKIYYFINTDIYLENDVYLQDIQLWCSEINGSDEKQVAEFKGYSYSGYDRLLIDGDILYMCMTVQHYDKDFNELETSIKFVSYDLKKNKINEYGEIVKGYGCGTWMFGKWDGKIIFNTSTVKDIRPYMEKISEFAKENELTEQEAFVQFQDEYTNKVFEFDIENGNISDNKLSDPIGISNDYYFYNEDNVLKYIDSKGNEEEISSLSEISDIVILEKYCVLAGGDHKYLFDAENNKCIEISNVDICAEYNDHLIVVQDSDNGSISYLKKTISELEK